MGNEKVAFCINRYMEDMVTCLNLYGGDIIKFVGDAMIVMWPPIMPAGEDGRTEADVEKDRLEMCMKALQCTQEIQKKLNNQVIMPGIPPLQVKVSDVCISALKDLPPDLAQLKFIVCLDVFANT